MSQPALSLPTLFQGTVVELHRSQLTGEISLANGNMLPVRFASVVQEQRLHLGTRLIVAGVTRNQARVLVRTLRLEGVSIRAHMHGIVARRLGRAAVEVLGVNGAADDAPAPTAAPVGAYVKVKGFISRRWRAWRRASPPAASTSGAAAILTIL